MHISSRGGRYSLEKLLALEEYTRNTSLMRAVLVCMTTPLPIVVILLAQEMIPLQDPAAGWSANYGVWIRSFIVTAMFANGVIVQAKYMTSGCVISLRQQLCLVLCTTALETVLAMIVAANVWFPIPFAILTMTPTFYPVLIALFYAIVGLPVIREILNHSDTLQQYKKYSRAQQVMAIIYPAYQVLFHAARRTKYELPVTFLLPVIKLFLKTNVQRHLSHMEDIMPEAVIFSVDLFNALYVATCVETASSTLTVVVLVLIDITQSVSVLCRLHRRTATILTRLHDTSATRQNVCCLVSAASCLCRCTDTFTKLDYRGVHIRSCLPHHLSSADQNLLNHLEKICNDRAMEKTTPCMLSACRSASTTRNKPVEVRAKTDLVSQTALASTGPTVCSAIPDFLAGQTAGAISVDTSILRETLDILFTTECFVLGAYLNAVVPLLYGHFLLVLIQLPSAKYHTELVGVSRENVGSRVESIFIFCLIEFAAFGLLAMLLYRNLRMQMVYLLAFVLESQRELILAKLLGWVLLTMTFRVVHFGVDFTLEFAWLKN